jgi:hypothetical protein
MFESKETYNQFCSNYTDLFTETEFTSKMHPRSRISYTVGGTTIKSLKDILAIIEVDEKRILFHIYDTMKKNRDWLYPEWDAPCAFAALYHAYELMLESKYGSMIPMGFSLLSVCSLSELAYYGIGLNITAIDKFASALNISFSVYREVQDDIINVGTGIWMDNFFMHATATHVIPISKYTITNRVSFKASPNGIRFIK